MDADFQVCRDGLSASPHLEDISINDPVMAALSISPKAAVAATPAPSVRLKTYSRRRQCGREAESSMPISDAEQADVDVVAMSPLPTSLPGLVSFL